MKMIYRRNPDVVYRVIAGEAILIPISRETQGAGRMLTLNETGAFIWNRLDGNRRLDEILEEIRDEFEVEEATARRDLLELIGALEETGAILIR
ncbi:MAG: PqqD family protein [Candidatus Erginobacter occultus]|nr:PqqD family protein [Candidatus Erginobacter occultus]